MTKSQVLLNLYLGSLARALKILTLLRKRQEY